MIRSEVKWRRGHIKMKKKKVWDCADADTHTQLMVGFDLDL